jgi:hypothetical protein
MSEQQPPGGYNRLTAMPGLAVNKVLMAAGLAFASFAAVESREFIPFEPHSETKVERVDKFIAAEAFKLDRKIGTRTLNAVGLNFAEHFIRTVETDVPAATIRGWTLTYTVGDNSLIKALGGEEKAVMSLAHIHRLMEMGERGPSHVDTRSNFAYARSSLDNRLWAIHWSTNFMDEISVGAVVVPHPDLDWKAGSRLFGG